ncbi:MAG: hypothetical protein C0606_12580 [Hyphomicrobiales bacterium]|nr:MAG: hypothetical protein C0606_12580 [Hyphomicrobiales bacterium]
MTDVENPLSHIFDVDTLSGEGTIVRFSATEEECAALAKLCDIPAVESLTAEFQLRPYRKDGATVIGAVDATVVQTCVVTLEPVTKTVHEEVDQRYLPAAALVAYQQALEVDVDPLGEDPPEELESRKLDLGAIAAEFFALGLDPYPRAPGVAFEVPNDGDDEDDSPFAMLRDKVGKADEN